MSLSVLAKFSNHMSGVYSGALSALPNLVFRREYGRLPYSHLFGVIEPEDYLTSEENLQELSKKALSVNGSFKNLDSDHLATIKKSNSATTANTLYWNSVSAAPINLSSDGVLKLANNDKHILINQIFSLMKKGLISVESSVAIINEGADNGDYLGLMVPTLMRNGAKSIKVVLINGNLEKLSLAHHFSSFLVGGNNVSSHVLDSFKDYPAQIAESKDRQQFHLPFRLVIVQRPESIISLLVDRVSRMKNNDILVASFLHLDEKAKDSFSSLGFSLNENFSEKYAVFEKPVFKGTQKLLTQLGTEKNNLTTSNAAFSVEAVEKIMSGVGGKILQMSLIPTQTDEKKPITTIGVIASKA